MVFVRALDQDFKFAKQGATGGFEIALLQHLGIEQAMQCTHPETIHCRVLPRQLVFVPTVLGDQWLLDVMHWKAMAQSQPQVVVFTGGQAFIEQAEILKG
jgi:hypothetical protein